MSCRNLNIYEQYLQLPTTDLRFNMCFLVEYNGIPVNKKLIEYALRNLQNRHPSLHFCVKDKTRISLSSKKKIPVSEVKLESDESWLQIVEQEIHHPFKHHCGPMCRVKHVLSNNTHALIITLDHMIADGISGSSLMIEFLEEISRLQFKVKRRFTSYELPNLQNYCIDQPTFRKKQELKEDSLPFPGNTGFPTSTGVLKKVLKKDDTTKLLALCKGKHVSIYCLLLSSAIKSMYSKISHEHKTQQDIKIAHNTPVNLRQFLPEIENHMLSCFVGDIFAKSWINHKTDIWDLARHLKKQIACQLNPQLVSKTWHSINDLMKGVKSYKNLRDKKKWFGPMVSVSNIGKVGFNSSLLIKPQSFFSFGALHGTLFSENNIVVIANIFDDEIFFSFSYPKPLLTDCQAEIYAELFMHNIKSSAHYSESAFA